MKLRDLLVATIYAAPGLTQARGSSNCWSLSSNLTLIGHAKVGCTWFNSNDMTKTDMTDAWKSEVTLSDNTRMSVSIQGANLEVKASGIAVTVAEIGEQLAWICCALHSHNSAETIRCTPAAIVLHSVIFPPSVNIRISRKVETTTAGGDSNGSCWKHLFRNTVLVEGYPIQRRPAIGTGLELPLDTMADLVQCTRMNIFNDQIFLKGFCTMLVAVQMVGDVVHWHAYTNKDGSYMNYYDHNEFNNTADAELLSHIQNFTKMRHVVGWCSSVQDNSGNFKPILTPSLDI